MKIVKRSPKNIIAFDNNFYLEVASQLLYHSIESEIK